MLLQNIGISHDAVWQLWIARQVEHGARLYTDILEVNPPLWFWMAVPVGSRVLAHGFVRGAAHGALCPFAALTYVLVNFFAVVLLGKQLTAKGAAGTAFVLFGLFLVTTSFEVTHEIK